MEFWKDIDGYEGLYQVSNMGNVRSFDREVLIKKEKCEYYETRKGKVLKQQTRRHGYKSIFLYKDGHRKTESIHRLVAEAFCIKRDGDTEVNHINEIKTDNRASNLEWVTHTENMNHGTAIQRRNDTRIQKRIGWKPVQQFTIDGKFVKEYPSLNHVGRETGYNISNICTHIKGSDKQKHPYGYIWRYADSVSKGQTP